MAVQVIAAAGAGNSMRHGGIQNAGPKIGGPMMKQPTFNWEAEDKYNEFKNSRLELNNVTNYITCHKQKR